MLPRSSSCPAHPKASNGRQFLHFNHLLVNKHLVRSNRVTHESPSSTWGGLPTDHLELHCQAGGTGMLGRGVVLGVATRQVPQLQLFNHTKHTGHYPKPESQVRIGPCPRQTLEWPPGALGTGPKSCSTASALKVWPFYICRKTAGGQSGHCLKGTSSPGSRRA